jgi:hypothetical protein
MISARLAWYAGMASLANVWLIAGLRVGCTILRPELGSFAPTSAAGSKPKSVSEGSSGSKPSAWRGWVAMVTLVKVACEGTMIRK